MTAAMLRGYCFAALMMLAGCAGKPPIHLADKVDLTRIYGGWYIVATIPNWFERGMVRPYDVYFRRPDGDIGEAFYMQKGGFSAPRHRYLVHDWVRPGTGNAQWRVNLAVLPRRVVATRRRTREKGRAPAARSPCR